MSTFLLSQGRWCARHATRVLAAWALLIAALGGVVATTESLEDVWNTQLPDQIGMRWVQPHTTITKENA